jgi:hypothetical protein
VHIVGFFSVNDCTVLVLPIDQKVKKGESPGGEVRMESLVVTLVKSTRRPNRVRQADPAEVELPFCPFAKLDPASDVAALVKTGA